ncbi:MAG: CoA-transferase subunit beta, partial [Rhodococcus erythropolis]|nr:CoA-transferase subunit beta [Rhodococcus erythropolis]
VFDFGGPGNTFRALSLHPGVTAEEVAENTSFEVAGLAEAGITRDPTAEELHLIRETLDPRNLRDREVSA